MKGSPEVTRRQAFTLLLAFLASSSVPVLVHAGPGGAIPAQAPDTAAPATDLISGLVRNGVGAAVDRALILLTPIGASGTVRTSLTDAAGHYQFDRVPAGAYRITALRDGYEAGIGSLSTWAARRLDLVLVPAGDPSLAAPRPDWVLTAPARDMLRDTEAAAKLPPSGAPAESPATPALSLPSRDAAASSRTADFLDSMEGEIYQSYTQADAATFGSAKSPSGGSGNATSVLVGSPIGDRLRWDFLGERSKENTNWREAGIEARQSSAERVRVNITYDTGGTGQLDMRAYYDHDALNFHSMIGADPAWTDRDRRGWGYDAGWAGSIDDGSQLQVEMKYVGSAVGGAHGSKGGRDDGQFGDGADANADANVWRGAARYSKNIGSKHGVHIGVKAHYYSFGGEDGTFVAPTAQQDPALFEEYGRNGWTVNVSAADSWRMLDPVALDFGFDVSRSTYSAGSLRQAMVPQAGVTFTPGPATTVRGAVSYVAFERELAGDPTMLSGQREEEGAVGYRLRVERRMGSRLLLILDGESRPCMYDSIGATWDSPGTEDSARTLYVSDPGSSLREGHVGFEARITDGILIALGAGAGKVDGHVGASLPDQDFLRTLPDGRIRYELAHVDGRIERTGTGIRVEITRLEQSAIDGSVGEYGDRRLLVQFLQGIGFVHPGNTDWSLVLAYASFHPDSDNPPSSEPDPALRANMDRISGGVSVKF